jgi:hypothetical protein
MLNVNAMLVEQAKLVTGLAPIAPSTSVPDYVSLKNYHKLAIVILVDNGATVTGSAITLKQAQAVANTGEKALAFSKVWKNEDTANGETLTETAVVSNTFTTIATNNLNAIYVIEVLPTDLDIANGFDCVRLGTGDSVNAVISALYILWPAKYGDATPPASITD